MRLRLRRKRPEPWSVRKQMIKHPWLIPLCAFEWFWEYTAFALGNWSFLEVLEYLGSFGVLIAVVFYFAESGDRLKQKHYQAWQVINTAQGKGGSGGRPEALQELNTDGVPLIGVDVSGAFLQGVRLERARLLRSNFSAADLRDSDFAFADFSDSNLRGANFRQCNLHSANFAHADLTDADLFGADLAGADLSAATLTNTDLRNANLAGVHWGKSLSFPDFKNANIFGVRNAPEGFVTYALKHGAIQIESDSQ
jgi:hypothetical protein